MGELATSDAEVIRMAGLLRGVESGVQAVSVSTILVKVGQLIFTNFKLVWS